MTARPDSTPRRLPPPPLQAVLWEEEGFKCQSRYSNQIAFSLDIGLLLRVLRSAVGHDADALEVKLAMRGIPGAGAGAGAHRRARRRACGRAGGCVRHRRRRWSVEVLRDGRRARGVVGA